MEAYPTLRTLLPKLPILVPTRCLRFFALFERVDDVVSLEAGEELVACCPAVGARGAVGGYVGTVEGCGWGWG